MNKKIKSMSIAICVLFIATAFSGAIAHKNLATIYPNNSEGKTDFQLNDPPDTPIQPKGPTSGNVGETLFYQTVTTDPDGDSLEYQMDWGDGTNTGWVGPIASGYPFQTFHSWSSPGTYQVKAKARDIPYHAESDWSPPLTVTISGEDTESPVVVIISPEDGTTFTEPDITLIGNATDNFGIASIGSRHMWEEDETWNSSTIDPPQTYYPFEWDFTLHEGWNRITIFAYDAAGNYGEEGIKVYYNASRIDLDIVWQDNETELVPDNLEDNKTVHVPGRCLSLNRGANHLKRIYVRFPGGKNFRLSWSDKLEIYEDNGKTIKVQPRNIYTIPKEFWVEATFVSTDINDQWVQAHLIENGGDVDLVVFTNFYVHIKIKTRNTDVISNANDKKWNYIRLTGSDQLGMPLTYEHEGNNYYCAGVEIVGYIFPRNIFPRIETLNENDFWSDEFYWRQDCDNREWINSRRICTTNELLHFPDDPHDISQDVIPENGSIYYFDTPGSVLPGGSGIYVRRNVFTVWCSFAYHEEDFGGAKGQDTNDNRSLDLCYRDCSSFLKTKYYSLRLTLRSDGWDNDTCSRGNAVFPGRSRMWYDYRGPKIDSATIDWDNPRDGRYYDLTIKGSRFISGRDWSVAVECPIRGGRLWADIDNYGIISKEEIRARIEIRKDDIRKGIWKFDVYAPRIDENYDGNWEPQKWYRWFDLRNPPP